MAVELGRKLGLFDAVMIMMGIVIGSGIFLTTGMIAKHIPSPGLILLVWLTGGLITLCGALTYAELGVAMPRAGGQYVYIREAYGPLPGFLFGWLVFLVYMTGGIAGLAAAFGEYFGHFFPILSGGVYPIDTRLDLILFSLPLKISGGQLVAVAIITLLSLFNYLGISYGKWLQNIFTLIKITALLLFIGLGLSLGRGSHPPLTFHAGGLSFSHIVSGFGMALIAVFWAFDGWNNINFVAGEIKQPKRNIPLTLTVGTLAITLIYTLINYVYLYALPVADMMGVERIAEKAATSLFSGSAGDLISIAILISILGSLNGSILTGPRVYYAMAQDRLFFSSVGRVSRRTRTPGFSILIQALWASLLALSGSFEQLITFAMFISIVFWIAATASVFTLRKKFPHLPRPYKTWGYPVIPILFITASGGILVNTVVNSPIESLAGVGFILIGLPVYFFWKRGGSTPSPQVPA